jgi:hypothetical protein
MSGRRPIVKIIAESLSQHDEKHVVPTSLSGIRVEWSAYSPIAHEVAGSIQTRHVCLSLRGFYV